MATANPNVLRVTTVVGELHVESTGSGPATVCWPSLFCDGRTLSPQVAMLALEQRVLVIDGPGHGRSGSSPGPFTLQDCAKAACQVLDAVGVHQALFLGSAWGGHVGVATALAAPERLRGLILLNAPMNAWTGAQRAKLWTLYQLFRWLGPREFLVDMIVHAQLSAVVRAGHPERAAIIADCVRSSPHAGLSIAVRSAMLDRPSLVSQLGAVSLPTLFVTGDADSIYPVALARSHAAAFPNARFEVIAGSAHQSGLECPDQVNALIRSFIAGLATPTVSSQSAQTIG